MKVNMKIVNFIIVVLAAMLLAFCAENTSSIRVDGAQGGQSADFNQGQIISSDIVSIVFTESSNGRDNGIERLISSMNDNQIYFYKTTGNPYGLFGTDDVIIIKINAQWAERGGTNTDLLSNLIRAILNHPEGFRGEIIIADNGQAQFGSQGNGGSLNWSNANSADRRTSTMDVIRSFRAAGHNVTGVLWDTFTSVRVEEFSTGDMRDGYVVENTVRSTGLEVSWPKFTTEFGTRVSFREGIWNANSRTYDSDSLKVINMPVLKSHMLFQVTGAVKNYMGVPSDRLTNRRSHNSVGTGGMGTLLAETRFPTLNLLDMIWIAPDRGPGAPYNNAVEINRIAASLDPVALDYWAAKNVLIPEAQRIPGGRAAAMNPDANTPGTFGHWLRLSMNELHRAGIASTMNESQIRVVDGRN